jgi:tRNA dimethylallyltransferase
MKKVLILLGPTGAGKTGASLLLAQELETEIISSDSMQIYRHMDIGTAKPSKVELQEVRHHMINMVEPWESYSTGAYIENVSPIIQTLHEQNKFPLIVGGTGLYIKAMTRGIFSGPSADWELRTTLLAREKRGKGSLYDNLKSLDPEAASHIMPADTRRVIRALEVCMKGEKTFSEMRQTLTHPLPYDFVKIGITRDRKELYRLIDNRVDAMMEQGLLREVKRIMLMIQEHGGGQPLESFPCMQAIGYKEFVRHLNGELSLEEAVMLVKQRSRNYAKRQFTWFRKEEGIQWVDVTGILDPNGVFQRIKEVIPAIR